MILFYPRDIGLWRDEYDFKGERPNKIFESWDDLKKYIHIKVDLSEVELYPVKFIEEYNHSLETTHVVHQWTVLGFAREMQFQDDEWIGDDDD